MDNMNNQRFKIEVDGILKEAEVLKVVKIDNRTYAIYTIENDDDTSDIFTSEVVKDDEGYDKLIDIDDEKIRKRLFEIVNIIFS